MNNFELALDESLLVMDSLRGMSESVHTAAERCISALEAGGKLLICGNGGSAAQAQHLTGELVGRYKRERDPLAAVTLGTDSSLLTCIGNDFSFDEIFSREVRALGRPGDVIIAFSTSGNSPNITHALTAAKAIGMGTVSFLGRDGGSALALSDCALVVDHLDTARIQEAHLFLMHSLMDIIESGLRGMGD